MKACEGQIGRVFVIRIEDGDVVPGCIERFAQENGVFVGRAILVGGIGAGDVVVGPRRSEERPPAPMLLPVSSKSQTEIAQYRVQDQGTVGVFGQAFLKVTGG
jgi:hypothetical protein